MALRCAHCEGSGTCKNGKDGVSCDRCLEKARAKQWVLGKPRNIQSPVGLPCSVCEGVGEPKSLSFKRTIAPALALLIVATAILLIAVISAHGPEHHGEVIAFLALCGGVRFFRIGTSNPLFFSP
jgi:hypothetical protein